MLTLAALCMSCRPPGEHRKGVMKLVAFVARYGHQPVSEVLRMPRSFVQDLGTELAELVSEEEKRRGPM